MANKNRDKGIRYELQILKELEALGFDGLLTTRNASRYYDGEGVDIISHEEAENKLTFYPQTKSLSTKPKYEELFAKFRLKKPLIIFHKYTKKAEKNFLTVGEYVIMKKEDFYNLIKNKVDD